MASNAVRVWVSSRIDPATTATARAARPLTRPESQSSTISPVVTAA